MACNSFHDELTKKEGFDDIVKLLATAFLRLKQRSELTPVSRENSVDFIALPSVHADSKKPTK